MLVALVNRVSGLFCLYTLEVRKRMVRILGHLMIKSVLILYVVFVTHRRLLIMVVVRMFVLVSVRVLVLVIMIAMVGLRPNLGTRLRKVVILHEDCTCNTSSDIDIPRKRVFFHSHNRRRQVFCSGTTVSM